jgi:hypothetical protein
MKLRFVARLGLSLALLGSIPLASRTAAANERHFTYTYETGVLNPGAIEFEPWVTWRNGRSDYYNRFDQRLEFEFGVVQGLQSALYLNFSGIGQDTEDTTGAKQRVSDMTFTGVSSEWKYQLSNPVADAIGSGLYLEVALGPLEAEVEGKLLFDKRVGPWMGALNLVGEHEWRFTAPGTTDRVVFLETDLAAAYFLTEQLTLGLEVRNVNRIESGNLTSSALYGGPVLAAVRENWWVATTVMPQLLTLEGASPGSRLDLTRSERVQARVILGFHL